MIKLAYASLDEVPEAVRGFCTVEGNVVSLDETKIKTQADVDAVLEGKRKEAADHSATKAKLAQWTKLGDSPEAVQAQLNDLQSRAGNANDQTERIAALQRDKNRISSDYDTLKADFDKIKPEYDQMKKQIHESKVFDVLEKSVNKLQGIDAVRLTRALRKDVALGLIDLDESGEGLVVKTGEKFSDYAMSVANDFNFKAPNTPGRSNPGIERIPTSVKPNDKEAPDSGFLDDEEKNLLDK